MMAKDDRVQKTLQELGQNLLSFASEDFDDKAVKKLIRTIKAARRNFVYGAGRSGMVGRCFVQRLMHIGLDAYFIGETLTPSLAQDDLLVVISGSGQTTSTLAVAGKARELGAQVFAVTAHPSSPIGKLANLVIPVKGKTRLMEHESVAPFTSQFDVATLAFLDGVVSQLMADLGVGEDTIADKHATVE